MNALTRFVLLPVFAACAASASASTFYPQPNPSSSEQYILELINAARANPADEGRMLANVTDPDISAYYSSYDIERSQFVPIFSAYAAKPPLAFDADLNAAARVQSLDQATNGFQGHDGSDGSTYMSRVSAAGYQWGALGENVYAYVLSPLFGHVGLIVDFCDPTLEHRDNILNLIPGFPTFKQVGISYVPCHVPDFGPNVLTEEFGTPSDNTESFLLGVVYDDANHNGSYDIGEGLGGVTITTDNGAYYTTTSASGGYVLPLPSGSGTLTITASGGRLGAPRVKTITYGNASNVKVDFTTAEASNGPALPIVRIHASETNLTPGSQPSVITITRKGDSTKALEVTLATSGNAIPGVDCTALPKTVTIAAGAQETRIPVAAMNVATAGNSTKKMNIKLKSGTGYLVTSEVQLAKAAVEIW